ncbi:MAG: CBS domain-containing protein, partial [Bryobacteraceae bacterium]|nr:CBS domain-containing protein [Bryobacteraceae bacterium]
MLIAGVIFASLFRWGTILPWEQIVAASDGNLLQRIAVGNLILALFNMLPAYPMDGGRVLRSLLARFQSEDDATRMAARAGQVLAMLMGLIGLLYMQFFLVFIALFVYLGASHEAAAVVGRSLTQGVPVKAAMVTDFRTLSHGDTIGDAANLLLSTSQQDFPVLHGGSVIGLLGRNSLVRSMAMEGPESYVASAMNRNFTALAPDMDLAEALPKMGQAGSCALVMDGAQLVGLLTA